MSNRKSRKRSCNILSNEDVLLKSNRKKAKQLPKYDELEEIGQNRVKYIAEQDNTNYKAKTLFHEVAEVSNTLTSFNNQEVAPGKRKAVFVAETDSKRQKTDSDCSPDRATFVVEQIATVKVTTDASVIGGPISSLDDEKDINNSPCVSLNYQELSGVNDISPDTLYESFWIPDLNLTTRHKTMLQTPRHTLPRDIVDAAQILLKLQFATEGLQMSRAAWEELQPVTGRAVQIHSDIDAGHCFTSCYINNGVEIADSDPGYVSPLAYMQIEDIYQHVVSPSG